MLSITAYLTGGFGRSGRVALALGVVALAWKYAIYAFVIALVAMFVLNFGA